MAVVSESSLAARARGIAPFIIEFIGTFFLVFTIQTSSADNSNDNIFCVLGIGLVLSSAIFAGGHISGAHYNPAVTIACTITRKIAPKKAVVYIVVQLIAGTCGAAVGWGVQEIGTMTAAPRPGMNSNSGRAFVAELVVTFLLAFTMMNVACTRAQSSNSFFGLAIAGVVASGICSVGSVSGAVFNPAVGVGLHIVNAINPSGGAFFKYIWIYLLAPSLGGCLAGIMFYVTNSDDVTPADEIEYDPVQ